MTVEFENPPINEVAVGLFFQPIATLRAEHVGAFWGKIRDTFPISSQNPPLILPGVPPLSPLALNYEVFPLPRFWFISADQTSLVQLQRDALFFNWRRQEANYPRFRYVLAEFQKYFSLFGDFLREGLGAPTIVPVAFEVTYVNLIGSQESVSSPSEYSKVVPEMRLPRSTAANRDADEFNHSDAYQLTDNLQLSVTHRSVRRIPDGAFAVIMEIKVTGRCEEDITKWFWKAHDIIIETFISSTDQEVQNSIWKKKVH